MARSSAMSERPNLNRLSGVEFHAARHARLQLEDKLGAAVFAEDDGRGELLLLRNETDLRRHGLAAVTGDAHLLADMHSGELRLRHEETHIDVLRRKDGKNRCRSRHIFSGAEIDG